MSDANVKLSDAELRLVCDEEFILTKNNIINKVYHLFGLLSENFLSEVINFEQTISAEVLNVSPKIYRGENYRGLPYVMLDYPRFFARGDSFAIRAFFWWGNFFSITLHLSGQPLMKHGESVLRSLNESWSICVNDDQWAHHFQKNNYVPASRDAITRYFEGKTEQPFLKIAKNIPLQRWDEAYDFFVSNFREILLMLKPDIA